MITLSATIQSKEFVRNNYSINIEEHNFERSVAYDSEQIYDVWGEIPSVLGYRRFVSAQASGADGQFETEFTMTLSDAREIMDTLTIIFDYEHNIAPTRVKIDGIYYRTKNAVCVAKGITKATTHTITISSLNKRYASLIIYAIYTGVKIEVNRRNVISISSSIFDRSDLTLPSYGIISNTGEIEFNDIDHSVEVFAERLLLDTGLDCTIQLSNTLVPENTQIVATMKTAEWNYDGDSSVVSVQLKDDLEELQDINVEEISYDVRNPTEQRLRWLYDELVSLTEGHYEIADLDYDTERALSAYVIKYPLLESCSLWSAWTKLCEVGLFHIYKNGDGKIVCRYNGGD